MEKTKEDKLFDLMGETYKSCFTVGLYQAKDGENAAEAFVMGDRDDLVLSLSSIALDQNNRDMAITVNRLILQSAALTLEKCDDDTFDKFEALFHDIKKERRGTASNALKYTINGNVIKAAFRHTGKNKKNKTENE